MKRMTQARSHGVGFVFLFIILVADYNQLAMKVQAGSSASKLSGAVASVGSEGAEVVDTVHGEAKDVTQVLVKSSSSMIDFLKHATHVELAGSNGQPDVFVKNFMAKVIPSDIESAVGGVTKWVTYLASTMDVLSTLAPLANLALPGAGVALAVVAGFVTYTVKAASAIDSLVESCNREIASSANAIHEQAIMVQKFLDVMQRYLLEAFRAYAKVAETDKHAETRLRSYLNQVQESMQTLAASTLNDNLKLYEKTLHRVREAAQEWQTKTWWLTRSWTALTSDIKTRISSLLEVVRKVLADIHGSSNRFTQIAMAAVADANLAVSAGHNAEQMDAMRRMNEELLEQQKVLGSRLETVTAMETRHETLMVSLDSKLDQLAGAVDSLRTETMSRFNSLDSGMSYLRDSMDRAQEKLDIIVSMSNQLSTHMTGMRQEMTTVVQDVQRSLREQSIGEPYYFEKLCSKDHLKTVTLPVTSLQDQLRSHKRSETHESIRQGTHSLLKPKPRYKGKLHKLLESVTREDAESSAEPTAEELEDSCKQCRTEFLQRPLQQLELKQQSLAADYDQLQSQLADTSSWLSMPTVLERIKQVAAFEKKLDKVNRFIKNWSAICQKCGHFDNVRQSSSLYQVRTCDFVNGAKPAQRWLEQARGQLAAVGIAFKNRIQQCRICCEPTPESLRLEAHTGACLTAEALESQPDQCSTQSRTWTGGWQELMQVCERVNCPESCSVAQSAGLTDLSVILQNLAPSDDSHPDSTDDDSRPELFGVLGELTFRLVQESLFLPEEMVHLNGWLEDSKRLEWLKRQMSECNTPFAVVKETVWPVSKNLATVFLTGLLRYNRKHGLTVPEAVKLAVDVTNLFAESTQLAYESILMVSQSIEAAHVQQIDVESDQHLAQLLLDLLSRFSDEQIVRQVCVILSGYFGKNGNTPPSFLAPLVSRLFRLIRVNEPGSELAEELLQALRWLLPANDPTVPDLVTGMGAIGSVVENVESVDARVLLVRSSESADASRFMVDTEFNIQIMGEVLSGELPAVESEDISSRDETAVKRSDYVKILANINQQTEKPADRFDQVQAVLDRMVDGFGEEWEQTVQENGLVLLESMSRKNTPPAVSFQDKNVVSIALATMNRWVDSVLINRAGLGLLSNLVLLQAESISDPRMEGVKAWARVATRFKSDRDISKALIQLLGSLCLFDFACEAVVQQPKALTLVSFGFDSLIHDPIQASTFLSNVFHTKAGAAMIARLQPQRSLRAVLTALLDMDNWTDETEQKLSAVVRLIDEFCDPAIETDATENVMKAVMYDHQLRLVIQQLTRRYPDYADLKDLLDTTFSEAT
eukprot:GILK01002362.1.p1 GENE.GILK01002362.1~~GILK01002362.1.p1  ORF type:complete len:1329 (+),score=364.49 GILK01002362.1:53-4039(+)